MPAIFRRADILWDQLRSGIWPLPAAMMVLGVLLFRLALWADAAGWGTEHLQRWWLYSGTPEDARSLLSTLVSSMITMASVVFSITVVTLTLAASQFGSRLVRSYVRDTRTGITLGLFVMTILYGLLGLRAIGAEYPGDGVPHITVTGGLVLGLACICAMLLFLHTVAQAIVADEVVRRVAADLEASINSLPPAQPRVTRASPEQLPETPLPVHATREGYVEAIRYGRLVHLAQSQDGHVRLHVMAGEFVARGDLVAHYARRGGAARAFERAIRSAVLIGPERTPVQDLAYSMRHLVDVALRALSPAMNDDNTALVVVDHLRGALSRLLKKQLPTGCLSDAAGVLRVVGPRRSHEDHISRALDSLRHAAAPHPTVVVGLIDAMAKLMPHAPDESMRRFLLGQAERVAESAFEEDTDGSAREAIAAAVESARQCAAVPVRSTLLSARNV